MASNTSHFSSYPPLDNVDGIENAQPYQLDREFQQMEHLQGFDPEYKEEGHRYPSPVNDLSALFNGTNNQQPSSPGPRMEQKEAAEDDVAVVNPNSPSAFGPYIRKPDRMVLKNADGKYACTLEGCQEEVREFSRRCEYNKHMDKHERPYKCLADGCEKLPGFTYSGGLLRHEREVHQKHGGPKKRLNCPHKSCKRYNGKGFSRAENLNEHIRRVHIRPEEQGKGPNPSGEETEEDAVEVQLQPVQKRKRGSDGTADTISGNSEEYKKLQEEHKKLKVEYENNLIKLRNHEQTIAQLTNDVTNLHRHAHDLTTQLASFSQMSHHLGELQHLQMQAPQAPMIPS